MEDVLLVIQVSAQAQYYKPNLPRNMAGGLAHWARGGKTTFSQLADPKWTSNYYNTMINHVKTFGGEAAWIFIERSPKRQRC
jgi:hypothetical protein